MSVMWAFQPHPSPTPRMKDSQTFYRLQSGFIGASEIFSSRSWLAGSAQDHPDPEQVPGEPTANTNLSQGINNYLLTPDVMSHGELQRDNNYRFPQTMVCMLSIDKND